MDFRQLGPKTRMSEIQTKKTSPEQPKSELYVTEQAIVQILALFGFRHSTVMIFVWHLKKKQHPCWTGFIITRSVLVRFLSLVGGWVGVKAVLRIAYWK